MNSFLEAIEAVLERGNFSSATLSKAQETLTQTYREGKTSSSLFREEVTKIAYLTTRCPATYAANSRVWREMKEQIPSFAPCDLLDLGAGIGSASWAALDFFPSLEKITLVEQSREAISLGEEIARARLLGQKGEWKRRSVESYDAFPEADLAVFSYALGELKEREEILRRLWKGNFSFLVLLEPGTPRGYDVILQARKLLLSLGAFLIAPCPHAHPCPLKGGDWCHFSARIARTRLHRQVKKGLLGYEDEKFSYLIASRSPLPHASSSRILRLPEKRSGHARLTLCTPQGEKALCIVTQKDKELYRAAKDAKWGDRFTPQVDRKGDTLTLRSGG